MNDINPASAIYDGLATLAQLAATDGTSERRWRRLCERLEVKTVNMGKFVYVDVVDLKAKLRGEEAKPARGRPRQVAA